MNDDELERTWKQVVVANRGINPGIFLDRPRETMKNVIQDSRCPVRDSYRPPPEYKFRELPIDQPVRLI
jgi:hypothetical protein